MKFKEIVYLSIYQYVWRYTFGQKYMSWYTAVTIIGLTQYMSIYLSMKFSDKVYSGIYWVHACVYFYSWCFVLIERAHTRAYLYVWVHTMCNYFVPACARPASLHPAGPPEFVSSTFVAETRQISSSTNHFILITAPPPSPSGQGPSARAAQLKRQRRRRLLVLTSLSVVSCAFTIFPIHHLLWRGFNFGHCGADNVLEVQWQSTA